MFDKATRTKLRFDIAGNCSTEDLWDFSKEDLANYEAKLQERIEKQGKRNRFAKPTDTNVKDELRLKIVSHIIDVKVAEEEESVTAAEKKQKINRLLELKQAKIDEAYKSKSLEEIETELALLK